MKNIFKVYYSMLVVYALVLPIWYINITIACLMGIIASLIIGGIVFEYFNYKKFSLFYMGLILFYIVEALMLG